MKHHSNFILCLNVDCFVARYLLPTHGARHIIKAPLPSRNQIIFTQISVRTHTGITFKFDIQL